MRVKWRTTSGSETSGTPARSSSRRRFAGSSSSSGVSSTSSAGSLYPQRPACERSKMSASFCVMCVVAFGVFVGIVEVKSFYAVSSFRAATSASISLRLFVSVTQTRKSQARSGK